MTTTASTAIPKTPRGHKNHTPDVPCGCWTGKSASVSCRYCGASYELDALLEFPVWRCYDCGASVHRPEGLTMTDHLPDAELIKAMEDHVAMNFTTDCRNEIAQLVDRFKALRDQCEWRPIETAPKDGTYILLGYFPEPAYEGASVGKSQEVAFWHSRERKWCGRTLLVAEGYFSPTHWMPLRMPPSSAPKEQG